MLQLALPWLQVPLTDSGRCCAPLVWEIMLRSQQPLMHNSRPMDAGRRTGCWVQMNQLKFTTRLHENHPSSSRNLRKLMKIATNNWLDLETLKNLIYSARKSPGASALDFPPPTLVTFTVEGANSNLFPKPQTMFVIGVVA